jgi:hypothetical protein
MNNVAILHNSRILLASLMRGQYVANLHIMNGCLSGYVPMSMNNDTLITRDSNGGSTWSILRETDIHPATIALLPSWGSHPTIPLHMVSPAQLTMETTRAPTMLVDASWSTMDAPYYRNPTYTYSYTSATTAAPLPRHVAVLVVAKAIQDDVSCPITGESITEDAAVTSCGHVFDRAAITTWLSSNTTCPTCRTRCSV